MATAGTDAASSATPSPIFAPPTEAGLASAEHQTSLALSGIKPANAAGASTSSMSAVGWDSTCGDGKVADGDEASAAIGGIEGKMELLEGEESFRACSADGEKADAEHMGDTEDELESRSDEEYLSPPPPPIEMEDEDVGNALLAYARSQAASPPEQAEHHLPAMSSSPPTPVRSAKRSAGAPLRRELASLYESSSLVSGSNGTHRPGRATSNSRSRSFTEKMESLTTFEHTQGSAPYEREFLDSTGPVQQLDNVEHAHERNDITTTTSTSLTGDKVDMAKRQFLSLVCSLTSDELRTFSQFVAQVLVQQRASLAKNAGASRRGFLSASRSVSSVSSPSRTAKNDTSAVAGLHDRNGSILSLDTSAKKRLQAKRSFNGKRDGRLSDSEGEVESDGEFDPAHRAKGKRVTQPKRAKRKRTRTDANQETLRSALSEVCDIDLKGIINFEVFERELSPEDKDRLMLLLPEVDRRDKQTLSECLRFNTHLNVALQQYQQLQRAGQLETDGDDVGFVARPPRLLDPWKSKYYEEYWGQRLGLPRPPCDKGKASALEAELPQLTSENRAKLSFSYTLPSDENGNHVEGVPPRKRKLDVASSQESTAFSSSEQSSKRIYQSSDNPDSYDHGNGLNEAEGGSVSLTKRRRARSTNDYHEAILTHTRGSGKESEGRTTKSGKAANSSSRPHLPPKKSHKQSVTKSDKQARSRSSSVKKGSSARDKEKEILEEFTQLGEAELEDAGSLAKRTSEKPPSRNRAAGREKPADAAQKENKKKAVKKDKDASDLSSGASFRRGAELILKREGKPMDAREIVRVGLKEGLFSTKGKTPQNTLASLLYMDIKNNRQSIFVKVKPMTFGLKEFDPALLSPQD